ncbi:MAG: PEPxxWA-CTERM sorting domain-containing protein [Sphingomonadaceae bacterium]
MRHLLLAGAVALATPSAALALDLGNFTVLFELPGVQNSTAVFDVKGVERFENVPLGLNGGFTTDFGTGGVIQATYTGGRIDGPNVFGSAGGSGQHIVTFSNFQAPFNVIDISFTTTLESGLNYFGFWLSALDGGNRIEFFSGGTSLGQITPANVSSAVGACPGGPYCGNPNAPFLGGNPNEPYAFLNIYFKPGITYDQIRIFQIGGGGYESDNHTVGFFLEMNVIPEPGTWAMMIAGFGLVGAAMRRRRAALAA